MLERVGGDGGLAGIGPGSGRFLGVEAVSLDLFDGSHNDYSINGSSRVSGQVQLESCK